MIHGLEGRRLEKGTGRVFGWLYWLVVVAIVLANVIPLAGEYLFTMHGWKSYFLDFHLVDEQGRSHSGLMGLGSTSLVDGEIFQYGFETDEQGAVEERKQYVGRGVDADGFHWGDRGFLWSGMLDKFPGRRGWVDGGRTGREIKPWQQGELAGPGAQWDIQGPKLSVLGAFPLYVVEFENDHFKMHLNYRSRSRHWYHWNQGATFTTGDFGHGNMSELPCDIAGSIVHKTGNERYNVSGWGLIEDAVGSPWNWFEWGSHNWFSSNYPNGWAVGFWLAPDDWQWGYNVSPHEAWVYDASRGEFYHGERVEFLHREWGYEDINGIEYPKSYRVRAVTNQGVVELSAESLTFKPILVGVKYVPLDIKMAYSKGRMEGTFTYFDGSSVALTNGVGTMEFFPRYVPNMIYITPWSLAFLVFLVGGRSIRQSRTDRAKAKRTVWRMVACWCAILALTLVWL